MIYERALNALTEANVDMSPGTPLLLEATVSKRDEQEKPRVIVDKVTPLAEAPATLTEKLHIHLYADQDKELKRCASWPRRVLKFPATPLLVTCVVGKDDSVTFIESRRQEITVTHELLTTIDPGCSVPAATG